MERLLNDDIAGQVRDIFGDLALPVEVMLFVSKEDDHSEITVQLMEEVTALSDQLNLSQYSLEDDQEIAAQYNVTQNPTIILAGKQGDAVVDLGVRILGTPSGHEFSSLIHSLISVSQRENGLLKESTQTFLAELTEPVRLKVFSTPTWPHCPRAVVLAHQFALYSDMVQAEMVEATQFPRMSHEYQVSSVPHIALNEGAGTVIGAVPEEYLVAEIQKMLAR